MTRSPLRSLALALALVTGPATLGAQTPASWSFDDLAPGTVTPFSQTKNGVTANFSAAVGPANAFGVGGTFFQILTGNVLFSNNFGSNDLGIQFSSAVDSLDVRFALNTQNTGTAFTVQTFLGLNPVATLNAFGFLASSGFVEGFFATQVGPAFDRVVISSVAPDLAIDFLNIRTAAVPEPATAALLLIGLGAVGAAQRRRRAVSVA